MKNTNTQREIEKTPTSPLVTKVLHRIESESITPKSWWTFVCLNCFVWIAWASTVLFGAISVAVLLYVSNRSRFELFEATNDSFLSFLIEILPLIWIVTFVVMILFTYFNMRHTKCGYRYPLWRMLGSSIVWSIGLGIFLNLFSVGYLIDTQFGKTMPTYTSFERMEMKLWQMPEEGRLVGALEDLDCETQLYTLIDTNMQSWTILTEELGDADIALLQSGAEVRIIGTTTDSENGIFYACGVFPWKFDEDMSTEDLLSNRKAFEERMYAHMEKAKHAQRQRLGTTTTSNTADTIPDSVCAGLIAVRRIKI